MEKRNCVATEHLSIQCVSVLTMMGCLFQAALMVKLKVQPLFHEILCAFYTS